MTDAEYKVLLQLRFCGVPCTMQDLFETTRLSRRELFTALRSLHGGGKIEGDENNWKLKK